MMKLNFLRDNIYMQLVEAGGGLTLTMLKISRLVRRLERAFMLFILPEKN